MDTAPRTTSAGGRAVQQPERPTPVKTPVTVRRLAGMAGHRRETGFVWRFVLPSTVAWLAFEAVVLLLPVWVHDESHSALDVLVTAPLYAVLITPVACLPGLFTSRKFLLATWTVMLAFISAQSAFAMVVTEDGQAWIAMLFVWFGGLVVVGVLGLIEWVLRRARLATPS